MLSDHTPHTASSWSAWLSSQKEASSKDDAQESPRNSLLKTSRLRTRITGTMTCGLMRSRYIYLVQMVSSVCGSNQVRSTKTSVSLNEGARGTKGLQREYQTQYEAVEQWLVSVESKEL